MFSFGRENTSVIAKWWRNIDKEILFLFLLLFLLGLFFSFSSTSSVVAEKLNKQTYFFFIKHLIFVFIALFLLVIISIQEKNKLIKFLFYLFLISLLPLFLIPLFGFEVGGSKRWIDLFFLPRIQNIAEPNGYNVIRTVDLESFTKTYSQDDLILILIDLEGNSRVWKDILMFLSNQIVKFISF